MYLLCYILLVPIGTLMLTELVLDKRYLQREENIDIILYNLNQHKNQLTNLTYLTDFFLA